jgi:DNA-binding transcriptional MerR regulator
MAKTVERLSAGEVVKITGISYPVLDYWVKTGFIVPAEQKGKGKGSDRLFSFGDVVAIKAALRLRALGASLQGIRQAVQLIQKEHDKEESTATAAGLKGKYLIWDGKEIVERTSDGVIARLKRPGQLAFDWVISLESVHNELSEDFKKPLQKARLASNVSAKRKRTA